MGLGAPLHGSRQKRARRKYNQGLSPLVNDIPQAQLWQALQNKAPDDRSFETLDDLAEILFKRCQTLLLQEDLIQGVIGFHWWLEIGA